MPLWADEAAIRLAISQRVRRSRSMVPPTVPSVTLSATVAAPADVTDLAQNNNTASAHVTVDRQRIPPLAPAYKPVADDPRLAQLTRMAS
jgi:hypothetical protein